ncbi:MAG TPA: metal-sulfur cluster assembly factor [Bacteroidia bacterium]
MNVITNNDSKCNIALAVLQEVIDPEIGLNVVDLGLIYRIYFDENESTVFVSMTLTTQFCPMGESMTDGVTQAVQQAFPNEKVNVRLTFDPPWNSEMISEEGKEYLNK